MTIFHYGLFSVHFSMLVNFKQKLVYLKYILFFPSLPFKISFKKILSFKVNFVVNSERSDLIRNQCYEFAEAALFSSSSTVAYFKAKKPGMLLLCDLA